MAAILDEQIYHTSCELSRQTAQQRFLPYTDFCTAYSQTEPEPSEWVSGWASGRLAWDAIRFLVLVSRVGYFARSDKTGESIAAWLREGDESLCELLVFVKEEALPDDLGNAFAAIRQHEGRSINVGWITITPIPKVTPAKAFRYLRRLAHEARHLQNAFVLNRRGYVKNDDACPEEIDCRVFQEFVAFPCKIFLDVNLDPVAVFQAVDRLTDEVKSYTHVPPEETGVTGAIEVLAQADTAISDFLKRTPLGPIQYQFLAKLQAYLRLIPSVRILTPQLHSDSLNADGLASWESSLRALATVVHDHSGVAYLVHETNAYVLTRLAERRESIHEKVLALGEAFLEASVAYRHNPMPRLVKYVSASVRQMANLTRDGKLAEAGNYLYIHLFCASYRPGFYLANEGIVPRIEYGKRLVANGHFKDAANSDDAYHDYLLAEVVKATDEIVACSDEEGVVRWTAALEGRQSMSKDLLVGAALALWHERSRKAIRTTDVFRRFEALLHQRKAEAAGVHVESVWFKHDMAERRSVITTVEAVAAHLMPILEHHRRALKPLRRLVSWIRRSIFGAVRQE